MSPRVKAVLWYAGAFLCALMTPVNAWNVWMTYQKNAHTTERPVSTTVAALSERGVDGNRHVSITDGRLGPHSGIHSYSYYNRTSRQTTTVQRAYHPLFPSSAQQPGAVVVVVMTSMEESDQLPSQSGGPVVQGMVNNAKGLFSNRDGLDPLPADAKQQLQRSYPDVDFSRCMVVNLGETPAKEQTLMIVFAVVAPLLLIGAVVCFVLGRRAWRAGSAKEHSLGA